MYLSKITRAMRVAIYQPRYFPQLHYFNRLVSVDTFVLLDSAQYTKALTHKNGMVHMREKSYQSDTPIRLAQGPMLLTVPVMHNGYLPLNQTRIDYHQKWGLKHLSYLKAGYQKAQNFSRLYPKVKELLMHEYSTLAALNIASILWALGYLLGVELSFATCTPSVINALLKKQSLRLKHVIVSTDISSIRPEGFHKGTEWTAAICRELGASEYLHGKTAMENYMNTAYYHAQGIQTVIQDWFCGYYAQQFPKTTPFTPNLSILDLLMNTTREQARRIIGIDTPYESAH